MKLKSTADGLKAVRVNPYNPNGISAYKHFEANNPALDLTTPMPGNTVFEGEEVKEYSWDGRNWYELPEDAYVLEAKDRQIRPAYAPLSVKEQVREEAPKVKKYDCLNCQWHSSEKPKWLKCPNCNTIVHVHTEASNPELGVAEAAEKDFEQFSNSPAFADYAPDIQDAIEDGHEIGFKMGANWQATQQQGLVSLKDVEKVIREFDFTGGPSIDYKSLIDKLKTLKQ